MLDLTFLATGFQQHVFGKTGEDDGWVYKIPVAFGRILPLETWRLKSPRARDPVRRIAARLPLRAPRLTAGLGALQDRLLVSYLAWKRLREFQAMQAVMEYLARHELDPILLPYRSIPAGSALLRVGAEVLRYDGPLLIQRRAEILRVRNSSFQAYEWRELIDAQQLLWRYGVALLEPADILGPRSWAVVDGRLQLADTGSLTRDHREARRSLAPERLDERERVVLQRLALRESGSTALAEEYFRFIRAELHQAAFDRLWGSALRPRDQRPA